MYSKNVLLCNYCKEVFGPKGIIKSGSFQFVNEKQLRVLAKKRNWKKVGPNKDACPYCIREKRHKRK